jgi:hypothetical protein
LPHNARPLESAVEGLREKLWCGRPTGRSGKETPAPQLQEAISPAPPRAIDKFNFKREKARATFCHPGRLLVRRILIILFKVAGVVTVFRPLSDSSL